MGAPRKPTALKEIQGNPGKKPLNKREPKPRGKVVKPQHVQGKAAQVWRRYAPELVRMGVLKFTDVDMFAAWCCLAAEFRENPTGMNAAKITQFRALASAFGLTPSARGGLEVGAKEWSGARSLEPVKSKAAKYF